MAILYKQPSINLLAIVCFQLFLCGPVLGGLTVRTRTGTYTGLQSLDYPHVREFRNIPYAQPPIGRRRWLPPEPAAPSDAHHFSRRFPPSCPQYLRASPSVWNSIIPDFLIDTYGQPKTAGAMAQSSSEDCLSMAIWTPLDAGADDGNGGALLPVAFFMPGGAFTIGGVDVPYQIPAGLVERTQKLIVVTVNYRLNIFGFPNAAALAEQNLGILDQRLALEWVHSNIAAFGGDPDRIIMWGHSAGGVSADIHNYAFHENPLVVGYFMQSGSAFSNFKRRDYQHLNFTFVAQRLGCDFPADADAELDCMRQVPAQMIINFIGRYAESGTQPPLEFRPVPDGRVVFDNYAARASQGLISRRPAVVGLTANEEATMIVWPWPTGANATDKILQGPSRADLDRGTVDRFVCVASNTTAVRSAAGNLTTYRYQYAGNFSGLSPLPWMGSYHTSDVPMFFGTYERPGPVDAFQRGVAEAMQDALVAFVEDPEGSQLRDLGWLPVLAQPPDGVQLRFGAGARIAQNITVSEVDGSCLLGLPYDSSP